MKVVIYARFSSHSQTEQSIEGQLKVCYDYAAQHSYTVIGEYIDRAISGTTDKRPQFQQMIEDSSHKRFEGVLVYQLDRFARDRYDSAIYKRRLKKNGVRVLSAKENITDDASGILIESVLEGMAEYYSAELAQKIRRGMDINAEKCLSTGSNPGLGFKVDADKRIQIDESTVPAVRSIFEMYASGKTVADICQYMNERGIKTSRGNPFNKNSLRKMLQNKRYIGIYTYKGNETPGGVPRIIDDDLFNTVQEIMSKNKKAPARARAKEEYLLTTKLFCGHCKEMMTGYSGTSKTGKVYHYYMCNTVRQKGSCHKKPVSKQWIEDFVYHKCREILTDENISLLTDIVSKSFENDSNTVHLRNIQQAISANERKHTNLINAVMECEIESVRKSLYEQLATLENERAALQEDLEAEQSKASILTPEMVEFFLLSLKNDEADTLVNRKTLFSIFVNQIFLYDNKITIHFNSWMNPHTVESDIIDYVESCNAEFECSLKEQSAPPKGYYTNTVYYLGGFAVTVWW